tara:strand:- start:284 stop:520 length:237 start_codon:yes stop_codon:yes gene_type:complete
MKKFIICIGFMFICSVATANIDYSSQYEISYRNKPKKSMRHIIREILNRKNLENKKKAKTFPVPLYDPIGFERVKNLA